MKLSKTNNYKEKRKMKRVRLISMLLSAAMLISAVPVTGVSAAQTSAAGSYTSGKIVETENLTVMEKAQGAAAATQLGWVKKNNKWYYVTAKGNYTGWAKIDGEYYLFGNDGAMKTGWQQVGNKWYLLAPNGKMITGWRKVNGKWYFMNNSGDMKTGWIKCGYNWFYLKNTGAMAAGGWEKIEGKWYYFSNNGVMYAGPHVYKIDGKYYFFESSGALTTKTGFQTSDKGNTFYTRSDGTVLTNGEVEGKITDSEGIAVNKVSNAMDQKAQLYVSDTNYLVLADVGEHVLRVYQGKRGEWNKVKGDWEFSCGAPATRTPQGQFKLCCKYPTDYGWKMFTKCKAAYCYWTTAGFLLHTILYDKYSSGDPEYEEVVDDRLGMDISMSCIRLPLEAARWIYTNIPHGTTLVVYE